MDRPEGSTGTLDQSRFGIPRGPSRGNPGRTSILSHLQDVRNGHAPGPRAIPWAAMSLRIPELDYAIITRRFPDLMSPDHEIKRRAWVKFAQSSLADPYRVTDRSRART